MAVIYIVEDDKSIQEIEHYALKNSGYEVYCYDRGAEMFAEIEKRIPALIILDIMLPDEDGLEILKLLRQRKETKKIPIIMVTAKSTELDKVKGLDMGADDYLTKPFGVMELISRVRALLRRAEQMEAADIIQCQKICLDVGRHTVTVDGAVCELTYKEFELLRYLMLNEGIVLSRDKIMDKVWGFEYEGESRTVDMHIKTLRQKLGESGAQIKTVRNVGYRMDSWE